MSNLIYYIYVEIGDKDLVVLHGEIKSPPMSRQARREAGYLVRQLQQGETLLMPHSRPMPSVGVRCHELRITDSHKIWRIIYRVDADAILILEVFKKTTRETPKNVIDACQTRLKIYDAD